MELEDIAKEVGKKKLDEWRGRANLLYLSLVRQGYSMAHAGYEIFINKKVNEMYKKENAEKKRIGISENKRT